MDRVMVAPARRADQVREAAPQNVCRWPTMTIRELTMAAADSALTADPLFHLGPGGHVGRIAVRYSSRAEVLNLSGVRRRRRSVGS